jgi:hypothetical protein
MNNWPKTISRLSSVEVIGVDDLLGSLPTEPGLVRDVDPDAVNEACIPHKALWADMLSTEHMTLGVIVSSTILKPASVAAQLASMAMERSIEPIIFSRLQPIIHQVRHWKTNSLVSGTSQFLSM